jgi:MoxR-like ATPase
MDAKIGMSEATPTDLAGDELAAVEKLQQGYHNLKVELHKQIVGQDAVIEELLIALFCRGHALLVGVPGLAKTLLISTLSKTLGLSFSRIQFTPDLMPSDITGTEVIEEDKTTGQRHLRFVRGPVFANVILADEINRTPPKTQAALLEAMQEHQVTAGGMQHRLPQPFFVLATQNPIEHEGTYPLPEAQLDRFLLQIDVNYPDLEAERRMLLATTGTSEEQVKSVLTASELQAIQRLVRRVPVGESVVEAILALVRSGRPGEGATPEIEKHVAWGPGPRASQALMLAVRARALLQGRLAPSIDDVVALAPPVLKHRMALNFAARADGVTLDAVIQRLLEPLR